MKINEFNRRDFLKLTGISTAGIVVAACGGAPAAGPAAPAAEAGAGAAAAPAAAAGLADIPREKSFIFMFGGDGTQFTDTELGNPYATGASHQMGSAALWEPMFFYSAFADEDDSLVGDRLRVQRRLHRSDPQLARGCEVERR